MSGQWINGSVSVQRAQKPFPQASARRWRWSWGWTHQGYLNTDLFAKKTPQTVKERSPGQHAGDGQASMGQQGARWGGGLRKPELMG